MKLVQFGLCSKPLKSKWRSWLIIQLLPDSVGAFLRRGLRDVWFAAAALHFVICLSCYNDSIISCCRGNRHICSPTQSPGLAQVLLCSCVQEVNACGRPGVKCSGKRITLFELIIKAGERTGSVRYDMMSRDSRAKCRRLEGEEHLTFFLIYIIFPAAADKIGLGKKTLQSYQAEAQSLFNTQKHSTILKLRCCESDLSPRPIFSTEIFAGLL